MSAAAGDDIVIIAEEEFDALNDDTFGGGEEEWDEDAMMARGPGPEDDDGGGFFAATAGHDFLELESGGQLDLEGCLEPEGLESEALEGQVLDDERVDFDGIGEEIPEELLNKVAAHTSAQSQNGQSQNGSSTSNATATTDALSAQFSQMMGASPSLLPQTTGGPPDDPAIINMVRGPPQFPHHQPGGFPVHMPPHPNMVVHPQAPPPPGMLPPGYMVQLPPGHHHPHPFPPAPQQLPPPEMMPSVHAMLQQQQQQLFHQQQRAATGAEFQDPAIMAMGQMPPGRMLPPQAVAAMPAMPAAPRVQQPEPRQHHQQQQQQHRPNNHQQPMHHHQQQQHMRHQQQHQQQMHPMHNRRNNNAQHYNNNNNSRGFHKTNSRNNFDDKNRETFGDDFVNDHHQRQHRPQQRYHYGERDSDRSGPNSLIMPGHVQTLGILRGARTAGGGGGEGRKQPVDGGGKIVPTGNPALDAERQREQDLQRFQQWQVGGEDEYAGLMTQRERQWVINIQLNQLKCENPYIDDYYYTVFTLKKESEAKERQRVRDMSKTQREHLQRQLSLSETDQARMLKRDEEGSQLLLPSETSGTGAAAATAEFKPQQFANSLGKLQAVSVKAPRKIIDVDVMIQDAEERVANTNIQKDSRNYKQILLELERMYDLVIDVEDCEKKLMALPTNTAMRTQVEREKEAAVARLGPALAVEARLKKYFVVRKGKALLIRALRLLDQAQTVTVCTALFTLFSLAVKKDREDKLLSMFWEAGLAKHLEASPIDTALTYLKVLSNVSVTTGRGASRSPPPSSKLGLKVVLATPLGVSVVVACLSKLIKSKAEGLAKILSDFSAEVADVKDIAEPLEDVDTLALAELTAEDDSTPPEFSRFVGAVMAQH